MEAEPELLARGSEATLYAIMDRVVDDYEPVVRGLENDIDEIYGREDNSSPNAISKRIN